MEVLWGLLALGAIILSLRSRPSSPLCQPGRGQIGAPSQRKPTSDDPTLAIPAPPAAIRARNAILRGCRCRTLEAYEMMVRTKPQQSCIEVRFFLPRYVLHVDIAMPSSLVSSFDRVEFIPAEGEPQSVAHGVSRQEGDRIRVVVAAPRARLGQEVLIHFKAPTEPVACSVEVGASKNEPRDLRLMRDGFAALEMGHIEEARSALLAYQTSFTENPWVLLGLSRCHGAVGEFQRAETFSLQALVRGLSGPAEDDYHALVEPRWFTDPAHRRTLMEGCRQWPLDEQHGLVVLERVQEHSLDLHTWRLRRDRELLFVRRAVTARMLSQISFEFSDQDYLLYTACRIIRRDGRVDTLPTERFVVGDSSSRDVSVLTQTVHAGHWLLPELHEGDQIEWTHHVITLQWIEDVGERQYRAVVNDLCHHLIPTYRSVMRINGNSDAPLQVRVRGIGAHIARDDRVLDNQRTITLTIRRYIPTSHTNCEYERYVFNPLVAFAIADHDWQEDAKLSFRRNFGEESLADSLPAALRRHFLPEAVPEEQLKRVFYWIRDRLKYAVIGSVQELIGKEGRAHAIIRAGVADCKDRTYLLSLACRELGLPFQIVAVSVGRGILIRDLPGEQCDHALVRVQLPDRCIYLDATNSSGVFGSIPLQLQGMDCLVLGEEPTIETLPVEPPEANQMDIVESFDGIRDGWLSGSFQLEARGQIARMMDEHWKAQTLAARGLVPSAQAELRQFLPGIVLESFERMAHTAESDRFAVKGRHQRCPLSDIGGQRVGMLAWQAPFAPVESWRMLPLGRAFVFNVPLTLRFGIRLTGQMAADLENLSQLSVLENPLCGVREEQTHTSGRVAVARSVMVNKRFVESAELPFVAPSLEAIEKAGRMTLVFRRG